MVVVVVVRDVLRDFGGIGFLGRFPSGRGRGFRDGFCRCRYMHKLMNPLLTMGVQVQIAVKGKGVVMAERLASRGSFYAMRQGQACL